MTIWETTNGTCTGNTSGQCTHWPEAVDVYVGNTWDGNFSNLNLSTNWTSLGTLGNAVASGSSGGTLNTGTGTFQYLLLIDKGLSTSSPQDGFDVAMVKVSAVPIPAAFWLFGSALLGMISLGRRHTSKSA